MIDDGMNDRLRCVPVMDKDGNIVRASTFSIPGYYSRYSDIRYSVGGGHPLPLSFCVAEGGAEWRETM